MKGRLRLCVLLLLALALLTYALFVAPSSNPIGRAASRIARRLSPGHEPIADVVEEHWRRDGDVFGVSIWAPRERYTRAPGLAFWYELGRGLPESLKRRCEAATGELPQPPDTDAMLVPAPAIEKVCEVLGPESLDLWVLLAEAKTPEDGRELTDRLDRRGIEWKVFGHDLCVRRRDRASAIEKLGLARGSDAYIFLCVVSVRTEEPDPYVAELTRVLEEARLPGFLEVSKDKGGKYCLRPYIRFTLLQPDPDQTALDLNERIRSTLAQLGAEVTVFQMFPTIRSLDEPAGDSQGPDEESVLRGAAR